MKLKTLFGRKYSPIDQAGRGKARIDSLGTHEGVTNWDNRVAAVSGGNPSALHTHQTKRYTLSHYRAGFAEGPQEPV